MQEGGRDLIRKPAIAMATENNNGVDVWRVKKE